MTQLIRSFHPIGFGAFYTEKHIDSISGKYMNIVYDCGTKQKIEILEKVIDKSLPKGEIIDILFISHFHKDHISGIPYLLKNHEIKKVIIPYIPKEDRILFVYSQRGLSRYKDLIIDTQRYFGSKTEVVRIKSELDDDNIQRNEENKKDFEIEIIENSGTRITLPLLSSLPADWVFIPFNYDYSSKIKELKHELLKNRMLLKDLSSDKYIQNNYQTIRNIYKKLFKANPNNTSLVCFSGMFGLFKPTLGGYLDSLHNRYYTSHTGLNCIYYGDANTNESNFLSRLKHRLLRYLDTIQTIQIPHHGSNNNFNINILSNPSKQIAVISCDWRSYNLPDPKVTKDILSVGAKLIAVSDKTHSLFQEIGIY